MRQLNIHLTDAFARDLQKFMKIRHISTKAEAIRTAIKEGLEHSAANEKTTDFSAWLGLAKQVPINNKPRFKSDEELWK